MKSVFRAIFALFLILELGAMFLLPDITSDFTWLGLLATVGFAWVMLELLDLSSVMWVLAFIAVVLDSASALFQLYSRIDAWDLYMHGLGGLVVGAAALEIILGWLREEHVKVKKHWIFIIVGVYLAVCAIGFLYEFLEYLVDKLQYGYPKTLVSAYDSVEDQLLNLLGGTLVLAYYFIRANMRRRIRN